MPALTPHLLPQNFPVGLLPTRMCIFGMVFLVRATGVWNFPRHAGADHNPATTTAVFCCHLLVWFAARQLSLRWSVCGRLAGAKWGPLRSDYSRPRLVQAFSLPRRRDRDQLTSIPRREGLQMEHHWPTEHRTTFENEERRRLREGEEIYLRNQASVIDFNHPPPSYS